MAKTVSVTTRAPSSGEYPVMPVIGWYQPHARGEFTGELVNNKTGEVYIPPSRTKQDMKDACDINNIIRDFRVTGQVAHMSRNAQVGTYADLPDSIDFQQSLELVARARESFASLPSAVRNRFNNNPAEFLGFMANPANQQEIINMGLATDRRPPPPPAPSEGAPSTPEPKKPA